MSLPPAVLCYLPRDAAASPLYRAILDNLESYRLWVLVPTQAPALLRPPRRASSRRDQQAPGRGADGFLRPALRGTKGRGTRTTSRAAEIWLKRESASAYLEQGRTELLRSLGVRYRDLEISRKLFLPAVEARCEYLSPSRYDDLLTIRTWISELGRASVSFTCEVVDAELDNKVVARVYSRHALVTDLWRPARVPADLRALLEPFIDRT